MPNQQLKKEMVERGKGKIAKLIEIGRAHV